MTALFFHPEAYTTQGPKLMGRHSAGESFLRAFLAQVRGEALWVQVDRREHAETYAALARTAGRTEPVNGVDPSRLVALTAAGVVHHPQPCPARFAWERAFHGHGAWSLTGVTHTTASASAMSTLVDMLTAPFQPWDALVCTSRAVRENVLALLEAEQARLRDRLGACRFVLPQLPVIPLGVHTADFDFSAADKAAARARVGAEGDTLVVAFVGRLSFHAKAHPLAMYQALERTARAIAPRRVLLVECGVHANEAIAQAYTEAQRIACPGVRVLTLNGRDRADFTSSWAAADLFCSLSDNIQESFGLTPVEAMAAGLPVVASDWDGYRDTVRDGVDGLLVPTLMPRAGLGIDLAYRHALAIDNYDAYCGHAASLVAVDVEACAHALTRLATEPGMARAMGEAGRRRAREQFDWNALMPRYFELWEELAAIRRAQAVAPTPVHHPWPARMDPLAAYARYPSATLEERTSLALAHPTPAAALERLEALRPLAMVAYERLLALSSEEAAGVFERLADGPRTAAELLAGAPAERAPHLLRGLAWLAKLGLLRRA